MKRGSKPQPKHLHVMKGTDRADRHSGEEPNPGYAIGDAPDHLGEHARWFWSWARSQWHAVGITGDPVSLEGMGDLYQRWRLAKEQIPDGGFYVCGKTGNPKRHPAATEALQAFKELRMQMEANALNMAGWARNRGGGVEPPDESEMFGT